MDKLCNNLLTKIFSYLHDKKDKESFTLVCKRFLRVEGSTRLSFRVIKPNSTSIILKLLQRYPDLIYFENSYPMSNPQLEYLTKNCPRIQVLNLNTTSFLTHHLADSSPSYDIGVDGICAIAKGCCQLREVSLRARSKVGDLGVVSLLNSARNLTVLDLGWCKLVTDFALKAIGNSKTIISLNLQGCSLITNIGLGWLAKGPVSKIMKQLAITECNRITDFGFLALESMCCLEELHLSGVRLNTGVSIRAFLDECRKRQANNSFTLYWL